MDREGTDQHDEPNFKPHKQQINDLSCLPYFIIRTLTMSKAQKFFLHNISLLSPLQRQLLQHELTSCDPTCHQLEALGNIFFVNHSFSQAAHLYIRAHLAEGRLWNEQREGQKLTIIMQWAWKGKEIRKAYLEELKANLIEDNYIYSMLVAIMELIGSEIPLELQHTSWSKDQLVFLYRVAAEFHFRKGLPQQIVPFKQNHQFFFFLREFHTLAELCEQLSAGQPTWEQLERENSFLRDLVSEHEEEIRTLEGMLRTSKTTFNSQNLPKLEDDTNPHEKSESSRYSVEKNISYVGADCQEFTIPFLDIPLHQHHSQCVSDESARNSNKKPIYHTSQPSSPRIKDMLQAGTLLELQEENDHLHSHIQGLLERINSLEQHQLHLEQLISTLEAQLSSQEVQKQENEYARERAQQEQKREKEGLRMKREEQEMIEKMEMGEMIMEKAGDDEMMRLEECERVNRELRRKIQDLEKEKEVMSGEWGSKDREREEAGLWKELEAVGQDLEKSMLRNEDMEMKMGELEKEINSLRDLVDRKEERIKEVIEQYEQLRAKLNAKEVFQSSSPESLDSLIKGLEKAQEKMLSEKEVHLEMEELKLRMLLRRVREEVEKQMHELESEEVEKLSCIILFWSQVEEMFVKIREEFDQGHEIIR